MLHALFPDGLWVQPIPIVSWLKGKAQDGLQHAQRAGELVTLLGGHPSLAIGALLEAEMHDIADILRESLAHEKAALGAYYDLLKIVEGQSVPARGIRQGDDRAGGAARR